MTKRTERTERGQLEASKNPEGFIPPHGGYQDLLSYHKALIVDQATLYFCDRFIDQMVQAARSGKQNILEGNQVSGTSKEAELKLTNVARGKPGRAVGRLS